MKISIAIALFIGVSNTIKLQRHPHERNYFSTGVTEDDVDEMAKVYGKDHFMQLNQEIRAGWNEVSDVQVASNAGRNFTESGASDHLNDLVHASDVQLDAQMGNTFEAGVNDDDVDEMARVYGKDHFIQLNSEIRAGWNANKGPQERNYFVEGVNEDDVQEMAQVYGRDHYAQISSGRNFTESGASDHLNDLTHASDLQLDAMVGRNFTESGASDHLNDLTHASDVQLASQVGRNFTESGASDHLNDLVHASDVQLASQVGRNFTESGASDHLNDLVHASDVQLESKDYETPPAFVPHYRTISTAQK